MITIVIRMIMVVVLITMAMGRRKVVIAMAMRRRKVVVMVNMMAMRRRKMVVVVVKEAEGAAGFGEHSPAAADHESFPGFPHNFYHGK